MTGTRIALALALSTRRAGAVRAFSAGARGLGLAPYARHHRTDATLARSAEPVTTASGAVWTLGLAVRWRRLELEQHVIVLFGAEEAISTNKEYYPITLGWRF